MFGSLECFDVSGNALGRAGVDVLLGKSWMRHLKRLVMRNCNVCDECVLGMMQSGALDSVVSLDLGYNGITLKGVGYIAESRFLTDLKELSLWGQGFKEDVREYLLSRPNLVSLKKVHLA